MASIAEMLVSSGLQQASAPAQGTPGSGIAVGAQIADNRQTQAANLAKHVEAVQQAKLKNEADKQAAHVAKIEKVGDWLKTHATMPDGPAKKAFLNGFVKKGISALGVEGDIDPTALEIMTSDPNFVAFISDKIQSGEFKFPDLLNAAKNPEVAAKLLPQVKQWGDMQALNETVSENIDRFSKDASGRLDNDEKAKRAAIMAQKAAERQKEGQNFASGQGDKANAEAYARKLAELNIPQIKTTLKKIDSKVVPGGFEKYDGKSQIQGIGGDQSLLPMGRLSTKGRENRMLFQDLGNDYIKMQTGAGVGVEEAVRLANSLGFDMAIGEGGGVKVLFTGTKSSADFVNGVRNLQDKMRELDNTLKAGAGQGAISYYEQNKQVFDSQRVSEKSAAAPKVADDQILKGLTALKGKTLTDADYEGLAQRTGRTLDEIKALAKKVK